MLLNPTEINNLFKFPNSEIEFLEYQKPQRPKMSLKEVGNQALGFRVALGVDWNNEIQTIDLRSGENCNLLVVGSK